MEIGERKLSATSTGALVLALPMWLCRSWKLKRGDYMMLELEGEHSLRLTPKDNKEEAEGG